MAAQLGRENVHDLSPEEVARGLAEGKVLLVDVREPNETAVERYPGAVDLPMSTFDPADLDPQGKTVVFACRSGNRNTRVVIPSRIRSGGNSRSAGPPGGVRLSLGQPLGHRVAHGAGCRPSL